MYVSCMYSKSQQSFEGARSGLMFINFNRCRDMKSFFVKRFFSCVYEYMCNVKSCIA